jgi:hypothetical protein
MDITWRVLETFFVVVMNYKVPSKRDNFRVVSLAAACCDSNLCRRPTTYAKEQWFATVSNSGIGKPAVDSPSNGTQSEV